MRAPIRTPARVVHPRRGGRRDPLSALLLLAALAVCFSALMLALAGPAAAQEDGGADENNPAAEESGDEGITGGLGGDQTDSDEEDYTGGEGGEQDEAGGGFAQTKDGPVYEAYPISSYDLAYYSAEDSGFWQIDKKAAETVYFALNKTAAGLFGFHLILMRATVALLEWVLTLNLAESLNEVVSTGISDLGNTMIGSGPAFTSFVQWAWALGIAAIVFYLFRARVTFAIGKILQMIAITALSAIIILYPQQMITWYTGVTNTVSDAVLSAAIGDEAASGGSDGGSGGAEGGSSVPQKFLDQMWTSYVMLPWGQIQVSSDPKVAKKYAEQALATPVEDRPDSLEEIKDEPGVEKRASQEDAIMHLTWAISTLAFGLIMAALLLFLGGVILVAQIIALVALMTSPVWLWFAIFPAGGVTGKMLGWFLGINLDVILGKLLLGLFLAVNTVILGVTVGDETMALVTRFLLSIFAAIAVMMLVLGLRKLIQEAATGGGLGGASGLIAANMVAGKAGKLASATAGAAGGASSGTTRGYVHPAVAAAQGGAVGASGRASSKTPKKMNEMERQLNEAGRAEAGESPVDGRNKKQKAAAAGKRYAGTAGNIGWKTTKAAGTVAGKAGSVAKETAKRLPEAAMLGARSGFMPFETAAAFGGVGAAAAGGAAAGAVGAGKNKAKQGARGLLGRYRQSREDKVNAARFAEEEPELTEKIASRMSEEDVRRYDAAEEDARQAYMAENPQYEQTGPEQTQDPDAVAGQTAGQQAASQRLHEEQPGDETAARGGAYPSQRPAGIPGDAHYDRASGVVSGNVKQGETPPEPPRNYDRKLEQTIPAAGGQPQQRYVMTPRAGASQMRGEAYDADAKSRQQTNPKDAHTNALRAHQRDGIVAAGYSSFDQYHADKKQQLANAMPTRQMAGESIHDFQARKSDHQAKVDGYDPAKNAPQNAATRAQNAAAYDWKEGSRVEGREQARQAARSWVPDGNGGLQEDPATQAQRAQDAHEDKVRNEQRAGIVAAGYSSFDGYHAEQKQQLANQVPSQPRAGEDPRDFRQRRAEQQQKVDNYDAAQNPPPAPGGSAGGSGAGFKQVYPTVEQIKKADPEGFKKYSDPRMAQEFTNPQQFRAVREVKQRAADPGRSRAAWDVTYYTERGRNAVKEGIQSGASKESIITGMKQPEQSEGQQAKQFQDKLRNINDGWLRNGPPNGPQQQERNRR